MTFSVFVYLLFDQGHKATFLKQEQVGSHIAHDTWVDQHFCQWMYKVIFKKNLNV